MRADLTWLSMAFRLQNTLYGQGHLAAQKDNQRSETHPDRGPPIPSASIGADSHSKTGPLFRGLAKRPFGNFVS